MYRGFDDDAAAAAREPETDDAAWCPPFTPNASSPVGYDGGCLTAERFDALLDALGEADASLLFGLNALYGAPRLPPSLSSRSPLPPPRVRSIFHLPRSRATTRRPAELSQSVRSGSFSLSEKRCLVRRAPPAPSPPHPPLSGRTLLNATTLEWTDEWDASNARALLAHCAARAATAAADNAPSSGGGGGGGCPLAGVELGNEIDGAAGIGAKV